MGSIRERIVNIYGDEILDRSALNIRHGAGVFKRVLAGKGFRTVLEIGTYRGCAAAEIAQYCDRVVTIDLRYGKQEMAGQSFDREELWRRLGIKNIQLQLVNDDDEKSKLICGLDFDFAFIDGSHDAKSVKLDFQLVRRCGHVLFHDYDRRGVTEQDCVCDFVDSLPRHQIEIIDIFALWTDDHCKV